MLVSFALTWDEFQPKMAARFENLLQSSEFSDVTLVSKDNTRIKAHRVILSSGSIFFNDVLSHMKDNPHPIIYLMGVEVEVLEAIMSFFYLGEVEMKQERIQTFMETATQLQVDGLHTNDRGEKEKDEMDPKQPFLINETKTKFDVKSGGVDVEASDMFDIKKKSAQEFFGGEEEPNDFNTLETKVNLQFPCDLCDFISERTNDLRNHMRDKHRHEQASVKTESFSKKGEDGLYRLFPPKRASKQSGSKAWLYGGLRKKANGEMDRSLLVCGLCGQEFKYSNSPFPLTQHLRRYHEDEVELEKSINKQLNSPLNRDG